MLEERLKKKYATNYIKGCILTKIIFLDVDGVLNSKKFFKESRRTSYDIEDIDIKAVRVLNTIIEKTNAKVVISSTWRIHEYAYLIDTLNRLGFKGEIIDKTPSHKHPCVRGNEIYDWMFYHRELLDIDRFIEEYKNYIILDDNSDMLLWQKDNFIQTDMETGLTEEYIDRCVAILNS